MACLHIDGLDERAVGGAPDVSSVVMALRSGVTSTTAGVVMALTTAAVCAGVSSQAGADVTIRIEPPTSLARGRTSVPVVTLQIPAGRFIPAETQGDLRGVWVQTTGSGFYDRALPTYPVPADVRLPGADRLVLAYAGTVTIRLPVEVGAGVSGAEILEVRVGYQLCDQSQCAPFRMQTARRRVQVAEPVPADVSLAYRIDASTVAILAGSTLPNDTTLPQRDMAATFAGRLATLPGDPAATLATATTAADSVWTVHSSRASYRTVTQSFAALVGSVCDDDMPVVRVARADTAGFAAERAKYFLATPGGTNPPPRPRRIVVTPDLTGDQRRALEALIDRQMRVTVATLLAPDPRASAASQPRERSYDRRIRAGEGRLVYHLEAFKLAPDDDTRLFVRAHWALSGAAMTGMTLWIRFDGHTFVVERTDAGVSRLARFDEMFRPNVAESPAAAGMLLNVIPGVDGWARLIFGYVGYESRGVTVSKYTPQGPIDIGVRHGSGC